MRATPASGPGMPEGASPPTVSVVLPCHRDHAGVLADCLSSLQAQRCSHPHEVVVVNSNNDEAVTQVASRFPVTVLCGNGHLTAGAARNLGVASATADLIAFIDADCVAEDGWLQALVDGMTDDVIATGGAVLNELPLHPIATTDNLMQFVDQRPLRPAGAAHSLPGCNLAIRKSAFVALGGFAEDIQPGEDTVLTIKVAARWPGQLRFLPSMRVRHRGRTSLGDFFEHQRKFGESRGFYGLHLTVRQQRLGRFLPVAVLAAIRRSAYILVRTVQWETAALPRMLLCSPVLLLGLVGWTLGFNAGCKRARREGDSMRQFARSE